jgi:hypothetical protein
LEIGSHKLFSKAGLEPQYSRISASQIARIIGMSYLLLAKCSLC